MDKVLKASVKYRPAHSNELGSPALAQPATVEMKPQETAERRQVAASEHRPFLGQRHVDRSLGVAGRPIGA
jgi:hypothetical protein